MTIFTKQNLFQACDVAAQHISLLDAGDCKSFVGNHYEFIANAIQHIANHVDEDVDPSNICSLGRVLPVDIETLAHDIVQEIQDIDVEQITPEGVSGSHNIMCFSNNLNHYAGLWLCLSAYGGRW